MIAILVKGRLRILITNNAISLYGVKRLSSLIPWSNWVTARLGADEIWLGRVSGVTTEERGFFHSSLFFQKQKATLPPFPQFSLLSTPKNLINFRFQILIE